jgi:pilus assembly protein CpaF
MERDMITMQELFLFEKTGLDNDGRVRGRFRASGIRPKCSDRIAACGIQLPAQMFEHSKLVA